MNIKNEIKESWIDEEQIELQEILAKAISALPTIQQTIILLRSVGYTQQDIATLLRVPRPTVLMEEHKAIAQLRDTLGSDLIVVIKETTQL